MNKLADELKALQKELQLLDSTLFEKIKQEEYSLGHTKDGLKRFREKAVNERNLRESYRGRAPYELLQNADDAQARHAAYILCKEGIAFVHDGKWFTGDNFISLADGWSDKDPNQCIGHKGLGFRSVLDLTPSPYLIRIDPKDFFGVKFSWGLNQGHIMETIKRYPAYRADYEKWKKSGQNVCPIMFIPGIAKKNNLGEGAIIYDRLIRGDYQLSDYSKITYTTMFWFPASDDIEKRVLEDLDPMPITSGSEEQAKLERYIQSDVSMLIPFLRNMESVSLYEEKSKLISVRKKTPEPGESKKLEITVEANSRVKRKSFYQMKCKAQIPSDVSLAPGTPRAVKVMKEAGFTLSVLIDDGKPVASPKSMFHVYFPTEEYTGFGFVVHGDFYVTPDRKRLMGGKYNEWLLGLAAQRAAGEFLTGLLTHYDPKSVYAAMAPSGGWGDSGTIFSSKFSEALKKRRAPFISHLVGMAQSGEVLLPIAEDSGGFLEKRFTPFLSLVSPHKFFVSAEVDNSETRKFFNLAGINVMPAGLLLDLVESVPAAQKTSVWWYEFFDYIANNVAYSSMPNADFLRRKLVLANNGAILEVKGEDGVVLCYPPSTATENIAVPECLSGVLIFLDIELAKSIKEGRESTEKWVTDRLNISKFEANDLIPRAVRTIVEKLYDGSQPITIIQLANLWVFLKEITDIARREFTSDDYWREIGRLPLPMLMVDQDDTIPSRMMAPAFLMYWPENYFSTVSCLEGVGGIRRISRDFLDLIIARTGQSECNWIEFFQKVGASSLPKKLKYSRSPTEEAIPLNINGLESLKRLSFCGERQKDENFSVVSSLKTDGLWVDYLQTLNICSQHPGTTKTLHALTILENFVPCCRQAAAEYENSDENWQKRLWSMVNGLEVNDDMALDKGYCGAFGQKNSHDFPLSSYIKMQMNNSPWLPSTDGPQVILGCFARFIGSRLISKGKSEDDLGDLIIPYVVAKTYEDMKKLTSFGIKSLDNYDTAESETLVRALQVIGEKLDSDWGRKVIVAERARWRLVRGAIQEIYRRLNQNTEAYHIPVNIKIAAKTASGISFIAGKKFYARSGSATEKAFLGILPIIDVDRPLKDFFEQLSVTQLIAGDTVTEVLVNQDCCKPAPRIKDLIVNELAPHLFAVNYDKGEKEVDRFIRRIKERFDVLTSESLIVSVSLLDDPSLGGQIPFRNYYLEKKVVPLSGAAEEYHFSLIVEGQENISFKELDADALGEVLTQVFMDRVTEEALGYFPRITSRFQQCLIKGNLKPMKEYLHLQLGIPIENQESVEGLISGDYAPSQAATIPPPPKARIIISENKPTEDSTAALEKMKNQHQAEAADMVAKVIEQVYSRNTSGESTKSGGAHNPKTTTGDNRITKEQQDRGLKGEIEIKRRLMIEDGWEGFSLLRDTRQEKCGFDFLCVKEGEEVKVEVKTFAENGYISVTHKELIESGVSKDKYYLIGLLDNGESESEWEAFVIQNPFGLLTEFGKFEIETRLQVDPAVFFGLINKNDLAEFEAQQH